MKVYYHGTEIERGKKAVKTQILPTSYSDERREQWLGDGIYFFEYEKDAYWWITKMHEYNIKKEKYSNKCKLFEKFTILEAEIIWDEKREFTNFNKEHFEIFETIQKKCNEKDKSGHTWTEGDVFNLLFYELGYDEMFDVIRWSFSFGRNKNKDARTKHYQQIQICVKNTDIIKSIEDLNKQKEKEFHENKYLAESSFNAVLKKGIGDKNDKWKKFRGRIKTN